jgi:hypothetical protein
VGSAALSAPLLAGPARSRAEDTNPPGVQRAKVYAIFFGSAPSRDDTDLEPTTNAEIAARLQKVCGGIDFTIRDFAAGARWDTVVNETKELPKLGYDGVVICGCPRDYDMLRTGLPTINVAIVNDFMNIPYPLFEKNRVVAAMLDPWHFSADPQVPERMFQDLVNKIKLIGMLKRMKSEKILTVTDSPYVNVTYGDMLKNMPPDYNEQILGAIDETFGTRVTKIGTREVVEDPDIRNLWEQDSPEAREIAARWIRNAKKMINTTEGEVVSSAKVYLAMKLLMQKHDATAMAFHIRTLTANPRPVDYVTPALATSEFQLDNVVAKCQSHLNIILSEMMLQYSLGRPSMLGDFAVDTYNNTSMVQHCEGPWNAWGDERRVPYILTDHRERQIRGRGITGVSAASWILYPPDEPVTMWQIDVQNKQVLVHTGKTVPMLSSTARYRDHMYEMM